MPRTGPGSGQGPRTLTYASAGVDIDEKDTFTESLDRVLRRTYTPRVIPNPGGFAGLVRLDFKRGLFARNYKEPVIVACCDGVGTKVKLAAKIGRFDTIGIDLVAMNVNDLVVQGAEPLLFLDYIATPRIDGKFLHGLVSGIAEGCRRSGCALVGGETAHMPDLYKPGDFDLAGFCVGVVELKRVQKPARVREGDVILGLESDGIHSNGYTLVRTVVESAGLDLSRVYDELLPKAQPKAKSKPGRRSGEKPAGPSPTLGDILLTPTRLYAAPIVKLLRGYEVKSVVTGMAHITGSGIPGNLCRALPDNLDALVNRSAWEVPALFRFLQRHGNIPEQEMWRVFNMGIGFCVIVKPSFADAVGQKLGRLGERVRVIGRIARGKGEVRWE